MFETYKASGVFSVPVGCDFTAAFMTGLQTHIQGLSPQAVAKIEIYVNTRRSARRIHELFLQGPARLLPRIGLITDLAEDPLLSLSLPPAPAALRRQLELARLVRALLDQEADMAPKSATFDLAESLAGIMDEMQGEGIPFESLKDLSVADHSAHWQRSLQFLNILEPYWSADDNTPPVGQQRQRMIVTALAAQWAENPPDHPVIVAGSTGSRGATALFMKAVAALPMGSIVLPGFDEDQRMDTWQALADKGISGDHPQSGFRKLADRIGIDLAQITPWSDDVACCPERNRLISLALRPAPITDQWLDEGPKLVSQINAALKHVTYIAAQSPRDEANAIALRLRKAAEDGQKAALITPDRQLTRRVSAKLQTWGILPDDSAGRPLPLTPPGVFLRLTAALFGRALTPQALMALLKHPLTHSSDGNPDQGLTRGQHLLRSRNLEVQKLCGGPPFIDFQDLFLWAEKRINDPGFPGWVLWLRNIVEQAESAKEMILTDWVSKHRSVSETLARGTDPDGAGQLWQKEAGQEAAKLFDALEAHADVGGVLTASEYQALIRSVLNKGEVREVFTPHPHIAIWGTLEARVQGADLVILGGLNDGVWPKLPTPDPWLNRDMRKQIGLPLPERQIGLSAHDFQQAVAAPQVILSRAIRDGEAPTVGSRWLVRLFNLLGGLGEVGKSALNEMTGRGDVWLEAAIALERPERSVPKAKRPAPCPPVTTRPKALSVTRIKRLVRDPYEIYARDILKLRPLDKLGKEPDALERGIALHTVMEQFVKSTVNALPEDAARQFLEISETILTQEVPWPAARRIWLARLARIADWFLQGERIRREKARPAYFEIRGTVALPDLDFTLSTQVDRIDRAEDGSLRIYDYKSGKPPSTGEIQFFDKQLQLEAAIAQQGGFQEFGPTTVSFLEYIGLGGAGATKPIYLDANTVDTIWEEFNHLIRLYQDPARGYPARIRIQRTQDASDYDHLSRFGEWEDSDAPDPQVVP